MHAVILAGGRGTRLRPLTDTRPKPLVPFMGQPFVVGLLRRLAAAGWDRLTLLVGPDAAPYASVVAAGRALGVEVVVETEDEPLDTAGAARRLASRFDDEPVLVCNGDVLTDLDLAGLLAEHERIGATATLALTRVEDTSTFGVVVCDEQRRVERFVEKPPPGTVAVDTVNAGTYVLAPDVFADFPGDGPLSFERDVFPGLIAAGRVVAGVASDAHWQDLGTPARYLSGHWSVLAGRCHWPPAAELRRVGPRVVVADSARVDDGARLTERVLVAAGCAVARDAVLEGVVLHEGVTVGHGARVRESVLAAGVVVGDGAVVGPGAVLGEGVAVPPGTSVR